MNVQIEAIGFDRLAASLVTRGERMYQAAKQEALRAGQAIAEDAKRAAPVDTGGLRASIVAVPRETQTATAGAYGWMQGGTARTFTVTVGPNKFYAAFVEFGCRPHWPPMQPILDWVKRKGFGGGIRTSKKTGRNYRAYGPKVDAAQRSIAFLIRRAIARRGTPARPYLLPAGLNRLEEFRIRMAEILRQFMAGGEA